MLLEDPTYEYLDWEELRNQYKKSLHPILKKRKKLRTEIKSLQKFILDKSIKDKDLKREALIKQQGLKAEDKTLQGIQSDLEYAIYWLKYSHKPEARRGIERRSIYQNTKLVDPLRMQQFFRSNETEYFWDKEEKENVVTPSEQIDIEGLLSCLTYTEKEVYLMKKGYALTLQKIADERGVSKASISATVKRAEKKIAKKIESMKELGTWNLYNQ
jgi:positive control factor